jgi:hypothetical protein
MQLYQKWVQLALFEFEKFPLLGQRCDIQVYKHSKINIDIRSNKLVEHFIVDIINDDKISIICPILYYKERSLTFGADILQIQDYNNIEILPDDRMYEVAKISRRDIESKFRYYTFDDYIRVEDLKQTKDELLDKQKLKIKQNC